MLGFKYVIFLSYIVVIVEITMKDRGLSLHDFAAFLTVCSILAHSSVVLTLKGYPG